MRVGICIPSRGDMMIGTAFDLATMCGYDSRFRQGDQAIYTVAGTLIFENHWYSISSKGKQGLERVTAIGCGVMLVKRKVFEETPKPWFYFYELPGGKTLGEDVHFCIAAHDAGFETWVDHTLSQEIGHIGQYTYSWADYKDEPQQLQRPKNNGRKLSRKK
jgi:hypothetical protein